MPDTPTMKMASALPLEPLQASLADRVVLVTGATGGLGRAISLACAQAGATVVIHGRVVRKLEALYDEIMHGPRSRRPSTGFTAPGDRR